MLGRVLMNGLVYVLYILISASAWTLLACALCIAAVCTTDWSRTTKVWSCLAMPLLCYLLIQSGEDLFATGGPTAWLGVAALVAVVFVALLAPRPLNALVAVRAVLLVGAFACLYMQNAYYFQQKFSEGNMLHAATSHNAQALEQALSKHSSLEYYMPEKLWKAALSGHPTPAMTQTVRVLLEKDEKHRFYLRDALPDIPPSPERLELVRLYMEYGAGNCCANVQMHSFFIEQGDTGAASLLRELMDDPVAVFAAHNYLDAIRISLASGYSPDGVHADGKPLREACRKKDRETLVYLLEQGADIKRAPDILACAQSPELAVLLADAGADVDGAGMGAEGACGTSPNMRAVLQGNTAMTAFFRERGASTALTDCHERSLVHYAAMGGSLETLEQLLEDMRLGKAPMPGEAQNLAEVLAQGDELGFTPLHWAAWRADARAVALLLQAGSPVDAPDKEGMSPLFHAARGTEGQGLAFLLEQLGPQGLRALFPADAAERSAFVHEIAKQSGLWREAFFQAAQSVNIPLEAVQYVKDFSGSTIAGLAAARVDVMRLLQAAGARLDKKAGAAQSLVAGMFSAPLPGFTASGDGGKRTSNTTYEVQKEVFDQIVAVLLRVELFSETDCDAMVGGGTYFVGPATCRARVQALQ